MNGFSYPRHGPVPTESMAIRGAPPINSTSVARGVPVTSMAIPSRGDAANAMTSTYIVDTNRAPTQLQRRQSGGVISYDEQRAWLRPGVPTFNYHSNNARLGLVEPRAYAGSSTPIIAMAMWNANNEQTLNCGTEDDDSEPPFVAFTGFVRECNPGSVGSSHTARRLWTVSTNAGGMISSDISDNIVRTAPDLPIVAGNPLFLVRFDIHPGILKALYDGDKDALPAKIKQGSFFALLCDNGICPPDTEKATGKFIRTNVKAFLTSASRLFAGGTATTTRSREWASLGKAFCTIIRAVYCVCGSETEASSQINPLGRVGRAIWLSSEVPSDETAVALAHFSNEGDTRGRLDVVLCSA